MGEVVRVTGILLILLAAIGLGACSGSNAQTDYWSQFSDAEWLSMDSSYVLYRASQAKGYSEAFSQPLEALPPRGQVIVGYAYYHFPNGTSGLQRAIDAFGLACGAGDARGCAMIGLVLKKSGQSSEATEYNSKSCELGNPYSCMLMGLLSEDENSERDVESAEHYFEKACTGGIQYACDTLAELLIDSGHKDEGMQQLIQNCNANKVGSCRFLASVFWKDRSEEASRQANSYLKLGCRNNQPSSCEGLAEMAMKSGTKDQSKEGVKRLKEFCSAGSRYACLMVTEFLSTQYMIENNGLALSKEQYEDLIRLNGTFCIMMNYEACRDQASLISEYRAEDFASAFHYLKELCDAGDSLACEAVRNSGLSAAKDVRKANKMLESNCRDQDGGACYQLGEALRDEYKANRKLLSPQEREQWIDEIADFYHQACDRNYGSGCHMLVAGYEGGMNDFQKDPVKAKKLRAQMCRLGHKSSCR